MPQETLGQTLSRIRQARGWSQAEVAHRLGLSQQGYARYEADAILEIPSSKLQTFSAIFGLTLEDLLALRRPLTPEEHTHA